MEEKDLQKLTKPNLIQEVLRLEAELAGSKDADKEIQMENSELVESLKKEIEELKNKSVEVKKEASEELGICIGLYKGKGGHIHVAKAGKEKDVKRVLNSAKYKYFDKFYRYI